VTGARRSATYQSTGSLIMSTSDEPWPKQLISVLGFPAARDEAARRSCETERVASKAYR